MGDHHFNPAAIAKASGRPQPQQIRLLNLGDNIGLSHFEIQPIQIQDAETGEKFISAALVAVGAKTSDLAMSIELRGVVIAELGRVSLAELKSKISQEPPKEEQKS